MREMSETSVAFQVLPVSTAHDADIKEKATGSQVAPEVTGAVFN
jgi:hypothetical protein